MAAGAASAAAPALPPMGDKPLPPAFCCMTQKRSVEVREEVAYFKSVLAKAPVSQKLFVVVIVLHMLTLLVERVYTVQFSYASYEGSDAQDVQRDELWLLATMCATAFFMVWFGLEAVLKANAWEIVAFMGTNAFLNVRIMTDYACIRQHLGAQDLHSAQCGTVGLTLTASTVLFATAMTFNVVEWALCVIMVPDLRWNKYKAIGSDVKVRSLYRYYEVYSSVRKMDVQFSVLLIITGVVFFSDRPRDRVTGLPPTILLGLAEVAWDRYGVRAVKRGDPRHMQIFWALSVLLPVYVISVGSVALSASNDFFDEIRQTADGVPRPDRLAKVAVLAIACVANRISTVVFSIILYRRFDSEEYSALKRLFGLGFTKYGRQRVRAAEDMVNPVPEGTELTAVAAGPASKARPASQTVPDSGRDDVAASRLAALYGADSKAAAPAPSSPANPARQAHGAVLPPSPPQPARSGGGSRGPEPQDSDRAFLARLADKRAAARG